MLQMFLQDPVRWIIELASFLAIATFDLAVFSSVIWRLKRWCFAKMVTVIGIFLACTCSFWASIYWAVVNYKNAGIYMLVFEMTALLAVVELYQPDVEEPK